MTKHYQVFQIGAKPLTANSGLYEYALVPIEPLVLWATLIDAEKQLEGHLVQEPSASLTILPIYNK